MRWYGEAAANAVHKAGFDGVEVHNAVGYLPDQFLQDVTNKRTDAYGGSIENRARFSLEVMASIVAAVGQTKAAIRLSPWNTFNEVRMEDPVPQFSYLVEQLRERFPDLAYIHVVSPAAMGGEGPKDPSVGGLCIGCGTRLLTTATANRLHLQAVVAAARHHYRRVRQGLGHQDGRGNGPACWLWATVHR